MLQRKPRRASVRHAPRDAANENARFKNEPGIFLNVARIEADASAKFEPRQ
jgi:hypothetical protein